jgi:phosphopantetheinyl transferase (holo-ACP synthase)
MAPTGISAETVLTDGECNMNMQSELAAYLTRMLGHSVAVDQLLTLTSGQQARAAGWLAERGFAPPQLRAKLCAPFTPLGLLDSASATPGHSGEGPLQRPPTQTLPIQAVGIDIQSVDEVIPADSQWDPKSSAEMTAIFTLREISYAQSRPSPRETLCGLFCAKEAVRKCDPALLASALTQIEILPDDAGKPCFQGYSLSISHSGGFAIAVAVNNTPWVSPVAAPASSPVRVEAVPREPPAPAPPEVARDTLRRRAHARAGALFENLFRRFALFPARFWRSRSVH